jgi:hypothetical protein
MTSAALVLPPAASAAPSVHCLAGDASVATAIAYGDVATVLVAEDAGAASDELAAIVEELAGSGAPLAVTSRRLDAAVAEARLEGVMATLVEAHAHGFTVLHRGGPTPIVVGAGGSLTRIVAGMPGPPLGRHGPAVTIGTGEVHAAASGDVLVLTTPSGIDDAVAALASAAGPTWDDVRYALTRAEGSPTAQEAFALISFP